jgi:hypothetical protein
MGRIKIILIFAIIAIAVVAAWQVGTCTVENGIELQPNQVTVTRPEAGGQTPMYLAADYTVTVQLPRYSFVMRFTPTSTKQFF